jgi:diguanylate cyclase (GGDEF)-like protein
MVLAAAGLLDPLDRLAYDGRMRIQPPPRPLSQILVVAYDEDSLGTVPWPWGRDVQAQLIDRLQGARAVLLDVLLADAGTDYGADLALAKALKRHGRVYLAVAANPDDGHRAVLPDATFLGSALGYGSIQVVPDADAIVRRTPLHFPLAAESDTTAGVRVVADAEAVSAQQAVGSDRVALMSLQLARELRPDLPLPPGGEVLPNFQLDPAAYEQVSAIDVLKGQVPPERFQDRLVLVGATAEGLNDFHILPVGKRVGILYQAQVITSLVHADWRRPLPAWVVPVLTGLAVIGSLLAWETLSAIAAALVLTSALTALATGDWLVWRYAQTWLPTVPMLLASVLSLLLLGLGRQVILARKLRQVVTQLVSAFQQREVRFAPPAELVPHARRRQPLREQIDTLVGIAEAFHAEWRFLQALIETNRDPVLVVDGERRVILSNSAGTTLFGLEAVGAPLYELLGRMLDADGLAEVEAVWQAVEAGQTEVSPPLIQHERQTLEVNFLPLAGGRGTLCLFEDITALHRRANTDGLTGLWNRRYFDEKLAIEVARYNRYGQEHPVGLIILDIDHFKKVNDTYGHQVGDLVIKLVAHLLLKTVRTTDLPVRYGGEEMCVLLTHTDLEGALILAERLRLAITELEPVDAANQVFHVSASFGVAVSLPGETPKSLIDRADQALYKSKEGGRNRVTAGDPGTVAS